VAEAAHMGAKEAEISDTLEEGIVSLEGAQPEHRQSTWHGEQDRARHTEVMTCAKAGQKGA
jgi:hypothetical protein